MPLLATSIPLTISLDFLLHFPYPICYFSCFLIIYFRQPRQKEGSYMSRNSATISNNMRKIHSKDTSIELLLCKALWHKGYRYRKNYKSLPGSPDIVLTKYKIAIFCDSEFFHGKDWEILKLRLEKGKNPDFWIKKIERNRNRDYENDKKLLFLGYTVLHFWGQDISKHTDECLQAIEEAIWDTKLSDTSIDYNISEY